MAKQSDRNFYDVLEDALLNLDDALVIIEEEAQAGGFEANEFNLAPTEKEMIETLQTALDRLKIYSK